MAGRRSKSNSVAGAGCLTLFALPFAGVGVFMTGWTIMTIVEHVQVSGWQEVPCTILEAKLQSHSDSDGGTTYEATARYSYAVEGKRYEGTRVAIQSGADNIGSFQQDAHARIEQHRQSKRPFPGYVDPDDPTDAVLIRDLRWGLLAMKALFGLVFGGVGFGLIIGAIIGGRKAAAEKQQTAAHPSEPWLWKEEWATGRIKSSSKTMMWFVLVFAVLWNLISAPVLFFVPEEVFEKENYLAAIAFIFPVVGLGLLGWAAWLVLRWRKYGESMFEMASAPGVLGGSLAGVIRASKALDARDGFKLVLNCVEKRTTGSGKSRSTSETTLWQNERKIARPLSSPGEPTAVPVAFAVPYDMPASTTDDGRHEIIWRLEISAAVPGIDYYATFDVPVFKTDESRPDFELDERLIEQYAAERDPEQEFRRTGVVRMPAPAGWGDRYVFPMFRNPGAIIGLAVFAVIWTGVCIGLYYGGAPLLFAIVFGLFDLLILYGLFDVMFYRSMVDVTRDGLNVSGGLFGLGRMRRIDASQLEKLDTKRGMQQGSRVYYGVVAKTKEGKTITLGKRMASKRLADVVIERMRRSMEATA